MANDGQGSDELIVRSQGVGQPLKGLLGCFHGRGPNAKPDHPDVASDRKGALIGEVLVKRDHDGAVALCPIEDLPVSRPAEPNPSGMEQLPAWLTVGPPQTDARGHVLVEKKTKG